MSAWLLLILTAVFAYLAYDSWSMTAPSLPYSEIAKGLGQDLSSLSCSEQEKLNRYRQLKGIGNLNQTGWVFAILAIGLAVATFREFVDL